MSDKYGNSVGGWLLTPTQLKRALVVRLSNSGHAATFNLGAVVLMAFVGPRPDGMECCHYDGNHRNNHLDNLRWDTHAANAADMKRHGTQPRGDQHYTRKYPERHPRGAAKLSDDDVRDIRADPRPYKTIAAQYGVHPVTIGSVKRRRTYAHVP